MITSIAAFEFSRRLRRISTYVYFLVFFTLAFLFVLMSGGEFASATVDFGTGGKVLVTSPFALNQIIMFVSFFGVIVVAALAGQATYQDLDSNSTAFFYTAPITKFDYLAGRFLGSVVVQVVIFTSVGLGAWVGTRTPGLDPARVGPESFYAFFQPYLTMVIPNLIFTSAIFFSLAALGKKMLPVYAGSVVLLIGYFVASQLSADLTTTTLAAMVDPFGGNAVSRLTQYWTPFQRNEQIVPLAGVLLWNRILWLAIGAAILGVTYVRFSFTHPTGKAAGRRSNESANELSVPTSQALPVVHTTFSVGDSIGELLSLTRLQFAETVKNVFFGVLVLAGALFAIFSAYDINNPFATPVYPVTWRMLELGGAGFTLFILAIITFYSGELVWRERDAQLHQIMDALPVRRWVLFCSKLLALMLIQVLLVLMVMACGLFVQVVHGYHRFQVGLYLTDLLGRQLIGFWILCAIAMLVHTIVNHKYLGHFVMVLYFVVIYLVLPGTSFQDYLYRVGQSPRVIFSDMNGYGPFAAPTFWFRLYWGVGAVLVAIATNLLWVRGMEGSFRNRLKLAWARVSTVSAFGFAACAVLFIGAGGYIYYNTHVLNRFLTPSRFQDDRAQYEIKYKQYQKVPQPRITDIQVDVGLYPEQRLSIFKGKEVLENKTDAPMDRVIVTLWPEDADTIPRPHTEVRALTLQGGQTAVLEDPSLGFFIYQLANPIPPHGRIELDFNLAYPNRGFVNSMPNTDVVHNGTFASGSYLPFIGYMQDVQLVDDSARHRRGLPKSVGLPKLEDLSGRQNNYGATAADWPNFEGTVSTSADQIAILPGYLQKEWMQDGRRYFHYKSDAPIMAGGFSVNSARYAVMRDRWRDVNLEIYYQPGHEFDLDRMMRGMKSTLDYCTASFSPFQFRQERIIEFPRYGDFAESFPNTIPFSEGIGFITYVDPNKKDAINLPFFVTAHEVGHQWWGHQVMSSNNEGATSIVETLAQYTALMVMRHTYGPESMKKFLRYQLDGYLRGRAQERDEEKPLMRVEPLQGYIHYNKGGQVMYALQDYIGEEHVNKALAAMVKDWAFKGPPYPSSADFVNYLRKETPAEFQYLYEDWFENITLFDNRAVSAKYSQLPDGKYQVQVSIEAKKYRADGRGQEHLIPLHDLIDIGVLDADGKFLYLQKQRVEQEHQDFTVTVDKVPAQAGIDPLIKLIDRNPDDNVIKVEKQ